jgi:uncharacterized membrane protein
MDHAIQRPHAAVETPGVRRIEAGRPLVWLRQGWNDLAHAGWPSLAHGAFVSALGICLLLLVWKAPYMVPAYLGGFLLVAPFAAIGLYAISRQLDQDQAVDGHAALHAWRDNAGSVALFGLMLAVTMIFWEQTTAMLFALLYTGNAADVGGVLAGLLLDPGNRPLALAFFGVGALLAAIVFALGVVTVPMMLDKPVDVITAALTSLRCCRKNPGAMLVWAALIASLTALGFASGMLGLIVIFPVLGHASWHAYRDLVE